jgi:hypothetical protein
LALWLERFSTAADGLRHLQVCRGMPDAGHCAVKAIGLRRGIHMAGGGNARA